MPRASFPSGRKSLLLLALAAVIIGGSRWWKDPRPPGEPVDAGQPLSKLIDDPEFWKSDEAVRHEHLRNFGPAGVAWLAYQVGHGRHPVNRSDPRPLDHAPDWLRRWMPERWGGLRYVSINDERMAAIRALWMLGPEAAPAIPELAASLNDETLVKNASWALNNIGTVSWPAVHEALEHGGVSTRLHLLESMEARFTGEKPQPVEVALVVAEFVKLCSDPDFRVRVQAAWTIGQCRSFQRDPELFDPAIPALIQLLDDPHPSVQEMAVSSLWVFGPKTAPAIPHLVELLDSRTAGIRRQAAWTLGKVDQSEKRSATRLRLMLNDPEPLCRDTAAQALKDLGLSPEAAPPKEANAMSQ
jgi:hypothetical protein